MSNDGRLVERRKALADGWYFSFSFEGNDGLLSFRLPRESAKDLLDKLKDRLE